MAEGDDKRRTQASGLAERTVAVVGLLIFGGMLAVLVYYGLQPTTPPDLQVRLGEVQKLGERYHAEVVARNEGSETAASTQVVGRLSGTRGKEAAVITFDYIPPASESRGGMYFRSDPRQGELRFDVAGYRSP